jgi:CRISPR system Cascade subunit CasD
MDREYLTFTLYGPLAAWGDIAVGQERPGTPHPSRSALLGLVAAALGLTRDNPEQTRLNACYGTGVCLEAAGLPLRDYHTSQVPSASALKQALAHTRRDELLRGGLNTILSSREYACDSVSRVALWARSGAPWTIDELVAALEHPRFPLYLGRKSCPPSLPLQPRKIVAAGLDGAFAAISDCAAEFLGNKLFDSHTQYFWDTDAEPGTLAESLVLTRRDQPTNRTKWHFTERPVHYARVARKG